ncbi:MAG: PEGA domain-containing protein [Planctomycetes bacterium]|nr:PEGA domain-containing protein [Planctomycetota bacterium]
MTAILSGCSERPPSLSITTDPPGATVFVDWKYVGLTPVKDISVEPGAHAVRIERRNHDRWSKLVAVGEHGPTALEIKLAPVRRGDVEIVSVPANASVRLSGVDREGKTPVTLRDVPYGTYDLTITATGYEPWKKSVEVKANHVRVDANLKSQMVEFYEARIRSNPRSIFDRAELAHHYMIRKEFDKGIEQLAEALKVVKKNQHYLDSNEVKRLYQELGKVYVGWFDFASESELHELQPRIQEIVNLYGNYATFQKQVASWGRQKDPNRRFRFDPRRANLEAIRNLQQLLRKRPKDVELLIRIAELYLRNYDIKQAREYLDMAMKLDPKNYSVHMQLSSIYRRMGKHAEAEKALEAAAKLCKDPVQRGNLHETLAGVYQTKLIDVDAVHNWYPKAVAEWQQAIKLAEDPERACQRRFRLALLYRRMGEQDKALDLFEEILKESKNAGLQNYAKYFLKHSKRRK